MAQRTMCCSKISSCGRRTMRSVDLKPQEILTAIRLPALPTNVGMAHLKLAEKESFDWPLADVAAVLNLRPDQTCERAAIVLGAAAPVPYRAKAAETALQGRRIDDAAAAEAGRAALDGAVPLARNAYKLPLFETLVRRAVLAAAARRPGKEPG
jgi:xanthine dehydrogenase YagS FAD-binding subunit